VTPQLLAAAFNLEADGAGGAAGFGGLCHPLLLCAAYAILSSFFATKLDIHVSEIP
jgi:hypothetical protein